MNVWFKCYPSDFLNGMADLDDYERGIYASLIFIMYDQGGSVPYVKCARKGNAKALARRCGATTRQFNMVVETLISQGKLIHKDGYLYNKRVFTSIFPEFISDLSLKYLVLIFPKWRKFNDLKWVKILDTRLQKKNNNKKDLEIVAPDGSSERNLMDAVTSVHGPTAWTSWFSGCDIEGTTIHPNSEFKSKRLEQNYGDVIRDAGFEIGEVRKAGAAA